MELTHIVSQQYPYINQKNCPVSIFKFSIKNDFLSQTSGLPKSYVKIFKNQKLNATSQTPIQYTIFHQYTSFTKYLYLLRYRDIYTSTPLFFCTSKFDLFDLRNPKIQIWQIPSSRIIPNPKWTKRVLKILNHLDYESAADILLEDTACRCFDLAHTNLAHQPNRATHLKSP